MARNRKAGNAYARGRRAALAFAAGRDHRGNPYGGALDHPERAQHEAWAKGYTREARRINERKESDNA